jgi:hypothetical protein
VTLRLPSAPQYSVHCAEDNGDAISQLRDMLRDAAPEDVAVLKSELVLLQKGAERQRKKRLQASRRRVLAAGARRGSPGPGASAPAPAGRELPLASG